MYLRERQVFSFCIEISITAASLIFSQFRDCSVQVSTVPLYTLGSLWIAQCITVVQVLFIISWGNGMECRTLGNLWIAQCRTVVQVLFIILWGNGMECRTLHSGQSVDCSVQNCNTSTHRTGFCKIEKYELSTTQREPGMVCKMGCI